MIQVSAERMYFSALPNPTDNCPGATSAASPASGSFFNVGTTQVTVTATDAAGNTDQCTFDVVVNDNEDPTAICLGTQTVNNDPGQCGTDVFFSLPSPTDNCPGATSAASPASGSFFNVGTTQVTVTATDAAGNTDQCTFDVVVNDNDDPVVICPGNVTQLVDLGQSYATVNNIATITAGDNCAIAGSPTHTITGATTVTNGGADASGTQFNIGTSVVTYMVIDAAGNTGTCSFNVNINGDAEISVEDPTSSSMVSGVSNYDFGNVNISGGSASGIFTIRNTGDVNLLLNGNPDAIAISGSSSFSVTQPATTTITPTNNTTFQVAYNPANDDCSEQTATISIANNDPDENPFTFTVTATPVDNVNPVANCPGTQTVSNTMDACGANVSFSIPTPTDNCSSVSSAANPASGSFFNVGTTEVTVTATDAAGNTNQCTFDVVVNDTQDPSISCPADITQSVDANCQSVVPDLTVQPGEVIANSSAEFSENQGQNGWYYGKYTAFNTAGFSQLPNFTGFVWNNPGTNLDFPQLDANGGHPQFEDFSWPVRRWVSDFTGDVTISGDFFDRDNSCGDGVHVRIFQNGNQVFEFLNIPISSNPYSFNLTIAAGDEIDFVIDPKFDVSCDDTHFTGIITAQTGVTASDNCNTVTITQSPAAGTTLGLGTTVVTVTATDAAGNTNDCTVNVTAVDDIAPIVTGSLMTLNVEGCSAADAPAPYVDVAALENAGLSISDNCSTDGLITVQVNASTSGTCPIVMTRTYTVTDAAGNVSNSFTQTINIDDNTAPAVSGTIADTDVEGCSAADAPAPFTTVAALEGAGLTITDACSADANITIQVSAATNGTCPIVMTRTYTVTDECGNVSSSFTHVINIDDNTAPVVSGTIADTDVEGCGSSAAPAPYTSVAALENAGMTIGDNCISDDNLTVNVSAVTNGTCPIVMTRIQKEDVILL